MSLKNEEIVIRKATIKDIPSLIKMMMSIAKFERKLNSLKNADKKTLKFFSENLAKWLAEKDYYFFIAYSNDKPVGYIFGWKEYISEAYRNPYVGYICDCYIDEKQRGKGISRKLFEILTSEFKKIGLKELKLIVLSNSPAVQIWEKMGFKEEYKEMRLLLK